jgi:ABC-type uncharacterized transport system permease subunit
VISGAVFSDDWFSRHNLHKNVLSTLGLFVFVILLTGHRLAGWRGRVANGLTMTGSLLLTLAYFGSRFVREVLL